MVRTPMAASLSPARRRLVTLMQEVNFGSIHGLHVCAREPVFDPPPRVVREVKFCAENGPRPEVTKEDFPLKAQVWELFAEIDDFLEAHSIRLNRLLVIGAQGWVVVIKTSCWPVRVPNIKNER